MLISDFPRLSQANRKLMRSLRSKRERDENQCFLIEGRKLCRELFSSDFSAIMIVLNSDANEEEIRIASAFHRRGVAVYSLNGREFDSLADAREPQGIIAAAEYPNNNIIIGSETIAALDGVADPGNVGAIIRAADWFGFRSILLGEGCADRFNPKTIRSSMGSIFRCKIIESPNLAATLADKLPEYSFYGASLDGAVNLKDCRPEIPFGIVFGNESRGISEQTLSVISNTFFIPGDGAESLNVSVAAGIAFYHFSSC